MVNLQRMWSRSYFHARLVSWALLVFLLLVVSLQQDSMSRDFVLFVGLICLGALTAFRELAIKQVLYGRFETQYKEMSPKLASSKMPSSSSNTKYDG